jgi:cytosine/uracil/thiamine/allantoin permease
MLYTCIIHHFPLTRVPLADLNGVLGNYATLGLNIADFSRYANKPSAQNVQAIVIPVIFSELPAAHSHVDLANYLDR